MYTQFSSLIMKSNMNVSHFCENPMQYSLILFQKYSRNNIPETIVETATANIVS